ncbi:MAG: tetratricopeptide repeat protein [Terriglobia bacterium]
MPHLDIQEFPSEIQKQIQEAYDAAQRHQDDHAAVGKLGMLLDLYNRSSAASLCYQRAHELSPKEFRWLYFRGSLLLRNKQRQEAVPILKEALRIRPDYLPAEFKLAEALVDTTRVKEAERIYNALVERYPQSAEVYYGLARIRAARGDTAGAVASYARACELFPTYGPAHYALALAYRKLGQSDKAQEHLRIYEKNRNVVPPVEDPLRDEMRQLDSSAVSYLDRGAALAQVGRIDDAIQATEKAVELDPNLVLAHINLVSLYGRKGDLQKAREQYQAVMALNPNQSPKPHYDYGLLLMIKGEYQEAEEALRRAIQIDPNYAQAHNNLGLVLERLGNLPAAVDEYRRCIASAPAYRPAHFNLGRILVNRGDYEEGIQQFLQILTPADESTPAYLYALGAAYGRAGDRMKALDYLRQARKEAATRGQSKLLADIEQDLRTLEHPDTTH